MAAAPAQDDQDSARNAITPLGKAGKAVIVFGGVLPGIATGTISVMLPGISDAFGGEDRSLLIKMVATAAGLGMMIGAPLGGLIADKIGRRTVLAAAVAVFAAFGLSAMLVMELWQLVVARFIVGFASGAMSASYIALIADHFDARSQGKWLGFNGAAATLLIVLLNPVAGALADTGWRNGFLVYAAALPVLLLVIVGIPRGVSGHAVANDTPPARGIPWRTVVLAIIGGTLATGTMLYWPFRLRELGVESARELAFYIIPNVLVVALAAISYGAIHRRFTVTQIFAGSGLLSALGLLVLAFATSPAMATAGLIIEGMAIGVMTPNLSMYAISIAPPNARARIVGLMKGVYYGSPFVTQFALEALNHAGGPSAALIGIAATGGALGIYMIVQMRGPGGNDGDRNTGVERTAAVPSG